MREECIITDNKPLIAILSKDVTMLSQWLQCNMLRIYQGMICIIYKPGPDFCRMKWLSQKNHLENKDQKITGMGINLCNLSTSFNMLVCTFSEDTYAATQEDTNQQKLKIYIIQHI